MTLRTLLALPAAVMTLALALGFVSEARAEGLYKNLKVLPENITKAELKSIMKEQNKALGVKCEFCHNEPSMDEDTKRKEEARDMMKMTRELNEKYPILKKGMTCMTCHNGKADIGKK